MRLILFEDEHLLVINKPAGWNTHAPDPYAGEGVYDWLKHREPRWARLAIVHRLDKETSGVLVFSKTRLANKSLTEQFTRRAVRKKYALLTDRSSRQTRFTAISTIVRAGEKYVSRPSLKAERAETRFIIQQTRAGHTLVEAEPVTGRTHQIRVHAADRGIPILGDTLYGGTPAARVFLHATEIAFRHPLSRAPVVFRCEPPWKNTSPSQGRERELREAFLEPDETNAYRLVHGAADGWPGWYVDRLGEFLLSQSESPLSVLQREHLDKLAAELSAAAVYHKTLTRHVRGAGSSASPQCIRGDAAPARFAIRENGLTFELSFSEGYSTGLFLDQRDNRRRFLRNHVAADFPLFASPENVSVLNLFAYTCGFSVAAAQAGAHTTSLDLSKKYLEWGRRNFLGNGIDPARHDFVYGDAFDWLKRWGKKRKTFDAIILDPPTFSQSAGGTWQAERQFGRLVESALPLLARNGVLFASTNAARLRPEDFVEQITAAAKRMRTVVHSHYVPQPPDFPITRDEPGYLKTLWLRLA